MSGKWAAGFERDERIDLSNSRQDIGNGERCIGPRKRSDEIPCAKGLERAVGITKRLRWVGAWVAPDFDLPRVEVDDPIFRNLRPRVDVRFRRLVGEKRRVRNFDDQ